MCKSGDLILRSFTLTIDFYHEVCYIICNLSWVEDSISKTKNSFRFCRFQCLKTTFVTILFLQEMISLVV